MFFPDPGNDAIAVELYLVHPAGGQRVASASAGWQGTMKPGPQRNSATGACGMPFPVQ
jgi:hypothetical protein